jgi:hypothetical protein
MGSGRGWLIHAVVGSVGGSGYLRTNRSPAARQLFQGVAAPHRRRPGVLGRVPRDGDGQSRDPGHPGAQLRLTDHDGWRITCFATNTAGVGWTLPTLEVRHRQRARAEDRIRALKDTGLRNLPYHG